MSHGPAEARHSVPPPLKPSAGQLLPTPSQLSATSHAPAEGRQTAVLLASSGQAALLPVQFSATSHVPATLRQTVVLGRKPSAGQVALAPEQVSATSQVPAAVRHVCPKALN